MHLALQIQEILLTILGHCLLSDPSRKDSDLFALARTCRTFKEPALDALWQELIDPSPLARCLPEASHLPPGSERYSFTRSLTQVERGILRNYTRRIRSITDLDRKLDWISVAAFLCAPTTEPLFPNLRRLYAGRSIELQPLLCMPFPSLISLELDTSCEPLRFFQGAFESTLKSSPNIRRISIYCADGGLDADTLAYLSRMPALTQLDFTPSPELLEQLTPSDLPLPFPALHSLTLRSEFLDTITRLLSRALTPLPAITDFAVILEEYPSKNELSSFFARVQGSDVGHTFQALALDQPVGAFSFAGGVPPPVLGVEDLQPCLAFSNLRHLAINFQWEVNMTSSELLVLASTWPRLEHLLINEDWGWKTSGGITPDGVLQLLQRCPSLSKIALAIDTRGYTEFRPSPERLGLTLPRTFSFDVLDSRIESASVPAMAAFLASIAPCSGFSFHVSNGFRMKKTEHTIRWRDAHKRANDVLSQCP